VEDRAADTWEPLVAIADAAGGNWPARARSACLALTGDEPDDGAPGTRLLADLREVWKESEPELFTTTILDRLKKLEESPWSEWGRKAEPITATGLAGLLKPYRVRSQNIRVGGAQAKGYLRKDLADAWHRYLPDTSQPSQRPNGGETAGQPWDGNGTASNFDIRPKPDQALHDVWDGGTAGTDDGYSKDLLTTTFGLSPEDILDSPST